MKLLFINQSRDSVPEKWLRTWVRGLSLLLTAPAAKRKFPLAKSVATQAKGLIKRELVVVFVNSGEMKRMNKFYRGKNYPTDVLSFEGPDKTSVGELVICPPVIRTNSKGSGLTERGELGYMIVHGVLHLLGMDHMSKRDEAAMFALQDAVYGALEKQVGLR